MELQLPISSESHVAHPHMFDKKMNRKMTEQNSKARSWQQ